MRFGFFVFLAMAEILAMPIAKASAADPALAVPGPRIHVEGEAVPSWKSLWDEARTLASREEYPGAADKYAQLLREKDIEEAAWEYTQVLFRLKEFEQSEKILERLVERSPRRLDYKRQLGLLLFTQSRFSRTADLLAEVVEENGNDQEARNTLAEALLALNRRKDALPHLEAVAGRDPFARKARRKLAETYYALDMFTNAAPLLESLCASEESDPAYLALSALVHESLGNTAAASVCWERVARLHPENTEAARRLSPPHANDAPPSDAPLTSAPPVSQQRPAEDALRMARLHQAGGNCQEALVWYRKYLTEVPRSREAFLGIANAHAGLGHAGEALNALERYLAMETNPGEDVLLLTGRLYTEEGRADKALQTLRRVLAGKPRSRNVLEELAALLSSLGAEEEVLRTLELLAGISQGDIAVFRRLADQQEKLGLHDELAEVLRAILDKLPTDTGIALRLTRLLQDLGKQGEARKLLEIYRNQPLASQGQYTARAELFLREGQFAQALSDAGHAIDLDGDHPTPEILLLAAEAAGGLGKPLMVNSLRDSFLARLDRQPRPDEQLVFARALGLSGATVDARREFNLLLENLSNRHGEFREGTGPATQHIFLEAARFFSRQGLPYEASQALRLGVVTCGESPLLLSRLFDLAIRRHDAKEADFWLMALARRPEISATSAHGNPPSFWPLRLFLMQELLRQQQGEWWGESGRLETFLRDWLAFLNASPPQPLMAETIEAGAQGVELLLSAGQKDMALELAVSLAQAFPLEEEPAVLLEKCKTKDEGLTLPQHVNEDPGVLLVRSSLYAEHGMPAIADALARSVTESMPDSLAAWLLLVSTRKDLGDAAGAFTALDEAEALFPDTPELLAARAQIHFKTGAYIRAAADASAYNKTMKTDPAMLLLQARSLWADGQWGESLAIYKAFLSLSVHEALEQDFQKADLELHLPEPERSFIDRMVGRMPPATQSLDSVMAPAWLTEAPSPAARLTASRYAMYRWQEEFGAELDARNSVERRDYYSAARQYRLLTHSYPENPSLLFDLAGVYSKLDQLIEEAAVYQELQEQDEKFPGLSRAIERNRLKSRPMVTAAYGYHREKGYEGGKDIRAQWAEMLARFAPGARHEVEVATRRIDYRNANDQGKSYWANRAEARYRTSFVSGLTLAAMAGQEKLDDDDTSLSLFSLTIKGDLGDRIEGQAAYSRDVIRDTLQSVRQGIMEESFTASGAIDLLPRLQVGGGYGFTRIKDGMVREGYDLWASSIILPEPWLLQAGYAYHFRNASEGSSPSFFLDSGFAGSPRPYWTPRNYWINEINVRFKHLLSNETLGRGAPRYYSVAFTLGHDAEGFATQTLEGTLCFELTKHFVLEASGRLASSPSLDSRETALSAAYRW